MALEVEKIFTALAQKRKKNFIYQGKEVPIEEVFTARGALPLIMRRANLLCDFLFGEPLYISYRDDPEALTGERIEISEKQNAFVLVMLLYDVLEELAVTAADGDIVLA